MRLLIPDARQRVPPQRTDETFAWAELSRWGLAKRGVELNLMPMDYRLDPFISYEDMLITAWERHDGFLVIEQDVVPDSIETVAAMAACPEELCFSPIESHHEYFPHRPRYAGTSCSAGLCDATPSAWFMQEGGALRSTAPGDDYAHQTTTGMIKFSEGLTTRYPKLELPKGRSDLDGRFYSMMRGMGRTFRVHLHWAGGERGRLQVHKHYKCAGDIPQDTREPGR